tara:strand:+ start:46 stop:645 length:600 start_codon:yes stop_codon:yes gene_type:complete
MIKKETSLDKTRKYYQSVDMSYNEDEYNPMNLFKDIVVNKLLPLIKTNSSNTIVNLGPLKGKWIPEIIDVLSPKKLICVDMITTFFKHLKKTYSSKNTEIVCVLTEGNELSNLDDNSIDGIISIDALTVGLPSEDIIKYIYEFKRVLKPGKKALVHFQCKINDGPLTQHYENLKIFRIHGHRFAPARSEFILFEKLESE